MPDDMQFRLHSPDDEGDDGGSLEFQVTPPAADDPSSLAPNVQRVIVKVNETGYVPDGFHIRSRIDDLFFTAEASPSAVRAASDDPAVESISEARRLYPEDTRSEEPTE